MYWLFFAYTHTHTHTLINPNQSAFWTCQFFPDLTWYFSTGENSFTPLLVVSQILVSFRKQWQGMFCSPYVFLSAIISRNWILFKMQIYLLMYCLPRKTDVWMKKTTLGGSWGVIAAFKFFIGFQAGRIFLWCYMTGKSKSSCTAPAWWLQSPRSSSHSGMQSGFFLPGFWHALAISTERFIFCHSADAKQHCFLGIFSSTSRHCGTSLFLQKPSSAPSFIAYFTLHPKPPFAAWLLKTWHGKGTCCFCNCCLPPYPWKLIS